MIKKRVLIPLDGSEFSERILSELTNFIAPATGDLILLRVGHAPGSTTGRPARVASADVPLPMYESSADVEHALHPVYASQEWDSLLARINDDLQFIKSWLEQAGYTVRTAVKFGDPGLTIVEFVEDEDIDLIAMTTHGRSGLSRLWLGSVAEHVLRNVSVPVLLLRSVETPLPSPAAGDVVFRPWTLHG
jgi:nucleotide-binding universal stress UspA family protein